ncbi:MAG: hypothetical protein HN580_20780 [Deltaproteobacteria bacterium]|nr:hypothetical protein [Deltaproteobacteria bacterium]MBT4091520.1 hypothetical protein [Deltaproteobacteria bacterium]MBT4265389.1 hypothetical protein [Deltaproteobacteria bacterium]MBT4641977.1 hypothetical protein [Deltaproteobacteria bacterium]MBT6498852.1 hypothetical protein [Deltaproteobacteria bacterium]
MIPEIQKICFVGAGTQGCINSLICSAHGYKSVLYDISEETLNQASMRQQAMGATMIKQGYFDLNTFEQALSRISITSDLEMAVESADLLNESVNENLELKRRVHTQFDGICPPKTLLTTNTSSLLVSELEGAVKRGEHFAALHFNGMIPFVDLVGGSRTSAETLQTLSAFIRSLAMRPMLLKKEKDGYLGNSMFISFLTTGLMLVIDGHADLEDVDRTWMMVQNTPSGPFGQMDIVGLNVVRDIIEEQAHKSRISDAQFDKIAAFLRPFIERGELGAKTGSGFYQYPRPAYKNPRFLMDE